MGSKRTISWNNYRSEITETKKNKNKKNQKNDLDYLIDPTSRTIDRLFVLSFKNGDNDPTRDSFDTYYMPLVEIKDCNALIEINHFFINP